MHDVIIIGAGPAGLFAALKLIENGLKPIVVERGKQIRKRRIGVGLRSLMFGPTMSKVYLVIL